MTTGLLELHLGPGTDIPLSVSEESSEAAPAGLRLPWCGLAVSGPERALPGGCGHSVLAPEGHPGRAGPTLSLAEGMRLHQTNSLRGRCGAGQQHKAGQAGPDSPPQLKEKGFQSLTASPAMSALLHGPSPAPYLRVAVLTQTRSGCGPC